MTSFENESRAYPSDDGDGDGDDGTIKFDGAAIKTCEGLALQLILSQA